jgi:Leucine-rich repeat (LRR) protein
MKLFLTFLLSLLVTINTANGCYEVERNALLAFKVGLHDPGNLMSSWYGLHCCNWSGVTCDDITEHVVKLNLRNSYDIFHDSWVSHALTGEIKPSLLSLQYLTHLDLSNNDFSNLSIPKFISSFENLVYLNLSFSSFQGVIPNEIGNLSRLQFLDLGGSKFTGLVPAQLGNLSDLRYLSLYYSYCSSSMYSGPIDNISWIYRLSNLRHVDLSCLNLGNKFNWLAISKLYLLETLILSGCELSEIPINLSHANLTSLKKIDLWDNLFQVMPNWLWNLTTLSYLDLGRNNFHGNIPHALTNLASLNYLNIGWNNFLHVVDLQPISKLHNLRSLDLSWLGIEGSIANLIKMLGPMWYNLEVVNLSKNNLSGNISSWIPQMKNLSIVDVSYNSLSGHIPIEIGTLIQLKVLDLSYNSLYGVITEAHFLNLSKLETLHLSGNTLTMDVNDKWVPPFQLQYLYLGSCKIGPSFPSWLQGQTRLSGVVLPNASIIGVVPSWFWNMSSKIDTIDLSYNSITGNLPASLNMASLFLHSNNISGPIPHIGGEMWSLVLSRNRINGNIPYSICDATDISVLDLSNNAISGEIPICKKNMSVLTHIDLSNNQITGELPASIGSMQSLEVLQLDNNKLFGKIPSTLQNCKSLIFLSLGRNNFSGEIPTWIGKLQDLVVFQLRSNKFNGFIPLELGQLSKLQILDLAHNSFVGPIPSSLGNLSSMKNSSQFFSTTIYFGIGEIYEVTLHIDINGQQYYTSAPLNFAKTIDTSNNNLNGLIPEEIWLLQSLINLNLSKNNFMGEIPETIGGMESLESLDLSFNNFSGLIPQALSSLSSLHNLNLSYNNFSGKIPTGRQLDTISVPTVYVGNSYLCGTPINKNCFEDPTSRGINPDYDDNAREMIIWFYLPETLGFILGFWYFWCVLIFKSDWNVAYFRMVDRFFDKICVLTVLLVRRLCW